MVDGCSVLELPHVPALEPVTALALLSLVFGSCWGRCMVRQVTLTAVVVAVTVLRELTDGMVLHSTAMLQSVSSRPPVATLAVLHVEQWNDETLSLGGGMLDIGPVSSLCW